MQHIRNSVLRHVRLSCSTQLRSFIARRSLLYEPTRYMSVSSNNTSDNLTARVIDLVKKFDKIDATKVTETADFQKDLCLDSLDRVELVMAFEQEFSIEIPDDKADKLACCADVVKHISEASSSNAEES